MLADPPPGPAPGTTPVGNDAVMFARRDAARTRDAVRYVESLSRSRPYKDRTAQPLIWLRKAKTGAGGINTATNASTPGRGAVTFCDRVGGQWVLTEEVGEADNPSTSGPVAANTFVTVAWVQGVWEVILEPCP